MDMAEVEPQPAVAAKAGTAALPPKPGVSVGMVSRMIWWCPVLIDDL